MPRSETPRIAPSRLIQTAAAIVVIFALRYAKEVLIPIALGVLFAFLLAPLVSRLERFKLKRVPAVLIVVLLAFTIVGSIGFIVARQLRDLETHLPQYTETLEKGIERMRGHGGVLSRLTQTAERLNKDMVASQPTTQATSPSTHPTEATPVSVSPISNQTVPQGAIQKVEIVPTTPPALDLLYITFGPVLSVLATAFIVIVLCIFMLISREDLRDRVLRLFSQSHLNITTQAMDDAATRVSRYLLMQALMNSAYGIVVATGLFFIHVPNPLLWGLLAALLRFLPYVGPWLGAAIPVLLAFMTLGSTRGFITMGMYATLELIVSSFVEPWLYGSRTGVSSVAILAAAAFWSWIWGGVGLLLSTPLTVLMVVLGKHISQLEFLHILLGDEPVFDPPTRYYQRLLASDQEEANELVEEFTRTLPLDQVYETVMIPALGLAHRDRLRGHVDAERSEQIRTTMREQVEEFGDNPPTAPELPPPSPEKAASPSTTKGDKTPISATFIPDLPRSTKISGAEKVRILCLPARDEADEIAGMMFAQVLAGIGFTAEAVSVNALASEIIELVRSKNANLVVISALPPSAVLHARYLCKRLHQNFPEIKIVIGLWTSKADLKKAMGRISCDSSTPVVSLFSEAIREIEQLTPSLLLMKEEPGSPI